MLLYQLNSEVINSPYIANTLNKLGKLAKRYSLPIATILDHYYKGVVAYRVQAEYNLDQYQQNITR